MTAIAVRFAQFINGSRLSAIPHPVVHQAERAFVNWMGCVLGGCTDRSVEIAMAALEGSFGAPIATVIGRTNRIDAPNAALLNGLSSSVHGFSDTHPDTVIHPTGPVASALIAVAEGRATSGAEFLHSLILGTEVECRLGRALVRGQAKTLFSFLPTGLTGAIGAAAAVARLRGLSEDETASALGIAAGSAGGLRETIGSMAAPFALAGTARNGLVAALLAEKGFSAADTSLDGDKGFARAYAGAADFAVALEDLGKRYELSSNTYKPYPCGVWVHPTIDVCLELACTHAVDPSAIDAVHLVVNAQALAIAGRKNPADRTEAQASLYHWAAAALTRRSATVSECETTFVRDAAVAAMRRRVVILPDSNCAPDEARGEIRLRDGSLRKAYVRHCRGSLARPMSDDELSQKFLGQALNVLSPRASADLLDACWRVGTSDNVGAVVRRFFPTA
jgi:2-methylcitrate dehydratase PrpD